MVKKIANKIRTQVSPRKVEFEKRKAIFEREMILTGGNATASARKAGYADPKHQGHRLSKRPEVAASIKRIAAKAIEKAQLSVDRTLQEVARIAYFDARKLYSPDGRLLLPSEWDDDTAAVIAGIKTNEIYEGSGASRELVGYSKDVKIADKNAALDKAMKHLGLYERDNEQTRESLQIQVNLVQVPPR